MSKVLVISTSLRAKSNSDILTEQLIAGAKDAGHEVEHISLKGKKIAFCIGCLACQKTQKCVIKDDAVEIAEKVKNADTLVFATPIYYYEMSGQMKTLLDRLNPLYPSDYRFRKVYMISTAAEDEEYVPEKAVSGLQGWVDCFEKAEFAGSLFCGGISDPGEADRKDTDVRLTDKEYKSLVGGMSKKERKDFDRRQKEFRRDREDDRLDAWLDFEDDMDDMGW